MSFSTYSSGSFTNRCTAPDDSGGQCGQYLTFDVLRDFKKLYEKKLDEIDQNGAGDCLELKNLIQKKWIEDLTEQTEMMAKVIKELEYEATDRVKKLEEKLNQSAKCVCAVMKRYQSYEFSIDSDETFQKPTYYESDVKNLLKFIARIRDESRWNIDGLQFYHVQYSDLFGKSPNYTNKQKHDRGTSPRDKEIIPINGNNNDDEATQLGKELEYLKSLGNIEEISMELKRRNSEFDALRQSMFDMRAALTEEVACKHDMISALRKDTQQLEERCLQADKQTAFKDDIIKELRKEIKQMKQQNHGYKKVIKHLVKDRTDDVPAIKHTANSEKARYSTVIFIDESGNKATENKKNGMLTNRCCDSDCDVCLKNEIKEATLSKSETDLVNSCSVEETPVKERLKFTIPRSNLTNLHGTRHIMDGYKGMCSFGEDKRNFSF